MRKLLLTLFVLTALSIPSLSFADDAPAPNAFTDVQEGDYGYWAIRWLKEEGMVEGYADGSYHPDDYINRAEFAKIVELFASSSEDVAIDYAELTLPFSDVDESAWYETYISRLYNRGIINGYSDVTFRPANNVNYAEACKMIMLATGSGELTSTGAWYEPYVKMLADFGGNPDTIESNDQMITRAEMAIMIYGVENNK
jgi:S-layer homology domain